MLFVDLTLHELSPLTDLFNDGSTFYRTISKGNSGNSASPFGDSIVTVLLKIEVDGNVIFDNFEKGEGVKYDIELY